MPPESPAEVARSDKKQSAKATEAAVKNILTDPAERARVAASTFAITKGIVPQDVVAELATATPEQLRAVMSTNFVLWSQFSGIQTEKGPFSLEQFRDLIDIYLDDSPHVVVKKAAQRGLTTWIMFRLLWECRYKRLATGLYFPTLEGVGRLSKARLAPIIESNPYLARAVDSSIDTIGLKRIKNIQNCWSYLYLFHIGGTASKDSTPLDMVAFDEVRLMLEADIEQALERISASTYKRKIFASTASIPNQDIDKRFLGGTQHVWLSRCLCSGDGGVSLAETFPECVAVTPKEVYYQCPRCRAKIQDPQNGRFVSRRPAASYNSYHVSQLSSRFMTAADIWDAYKSCTNLKEFYNAKLGLCYVDLENVPINDDILANCVDDTLLWGTNPAFPEKLKSGCSMGVDQHNNRFGIYVMITKRLPDGRKQLVHLEVIDNRDPQLHGGGPPESPFKRLHQLMREYDVGMCVIDAQPNFHEASALARAFPGRVFLAYYDKSATDEVRWSDKTNLRESVRKGGSELHLRWQVHISRYKAIDNTLHEFINRKILIPNPRAIRQRIWQEDSGRFEVEPLCETVFFRHLKSIAREQDSVNPETGEYKMVWKNWGCDPHFVHAAVFNRVAFERAKRAPLVSFM